jgi:two-component system OmpR family response regulator
MADAAEGVVTLTPLDLPAVNLPVRRSDPRVLLLDDNLALLGWLEAVLRGANLETISATTAAQAREAVANRRPEVALFDVVLPDGDGLALALELRTADPALQVILMTGTELSAEETDECERHDIPVLRKPFLGQDAISLIQARLVHARAARGSGR